MKRVFMMFLSIGIIASCYGCSNDKKEIEKEVTNTLDGLKTGQIDEDSLFAHQDVMDLGASTKKSQNEHADKIAKKNQEQS